LLINNGNRTVSRQLRQAILAEFLNIQNQRSVEIKNDHLAASFDSKKATQRGQGTTQKKSVKFHLQLPDTKTKKRVEPSPWSEFQVTTGLLETLEDALTGLLETLEDALTGLLETLEDTLVTIWCCSYDGFESTDFGSSLSFSDDGNTYDGWNETDIPARFRFKFMGYK
jgi:hypothetical protein